MWSARSSPSLQADVADASQLAAALRSGERPAKVWPCVSTLFWESRSRCSSARAPRRAGARSAARARRRPKRIRRRARALRRRAAVVRATRRCASARMRSARSTRTAVAFAPATLARARSPRPRTCLGPALVRRRSRSSRAPLGSLRRSWAAPTHCPCQAVHVCFDRGIRVLLDGHTRAPVTTESWSGGHARFVSKVTRPLRFEETFGASGRRCVLDGTDPARAGAINVA
jgi:hypothetical protein